VVGYHRFRCFHGEYGSSMDLWNTTRHHNPEDINLKQFLA